MTTGGGSFGEAGVPVGALAEEVAEASGAALAAALAGGAATVGTLGAGAGAGVWVLHAASAPRIASTINAGQGCFTELPRASGSGLASAMPASKFAREKKPG